MKNDDLSKKLQEEFEEISKYFSQANSFNFEDLAMNLIYDLLQELGAKEGAEIDFDKLSDKEKEKLINKLYNLAKQIENSKSLNEADKEAISYILLVYLNIFRKKIEKAKEKKEEQEEILDKKEQERLKLHLRKMMSYEMYKFFNPRRVAGETEIENFINNLVKGGVELAKQFSKMDAKTLENAAEIIVSAAEIGRGNLEEALKNKQISLEDNSFIDKPPKINLPTNGQNNGRSI